MSQQFTEEQLTQVLHEKFTFKEFRPGQVPLLLSLLNQGNVLCIQPTGYGKSLLYQLAACLLDGLTVVVSPLLALMRDQEEHLNKRFGIAAASINSDQTEEENARARSDALHGRLKVLFVAPEQLDHVDRFNFLLNLPVKLLVVDEAHCISTWGHDFRPSYREIIKYTQALQNKYADLRVLGLTATANAQTEEDVRKQLEIPGKSLQVFREKMDRPNLSLGVIRLDGLAAKFAATAKLINEIEGSGLIYCATRENTELLAEYLQAQGVSCEPYHAGLDPQDKRRLQKEFIADKYKVITATNALGMGIDKPNIRFIIHFDVPGSITAYYQEVGRAGRDGLPAQGLLLFDPEDKKIQKYFIDSAQPKVDDFSLILDRVKNAEAPPGLIMIKRLTGLHPTRVTVVVAELLEQGFLQKSSLHGKQVYHSINNERALDLSRYQAQHTVKMTELNKIMQYAEEGKHCHMGLLRHALGDSEIESCGRCSFCQKDFSSYTEDSETVMKINHWLSTRTVRIAPMRMNNVSEGTALIDGKIRSPAFLHFMKNRKETSQIDLGITEEHLKLLKQEAERFAQVSPIACIVPIPSRTWGARDALAKIIAEQLQVPLFDSYLQWKQVPESRQGELLNNDQRRYNVQNKMGVFGQRPISSGALILFDDYTGSGATLKEAVRALRKDGGWNGAIFPFTMACVKWRLGKPGLI
jgi:ATP-dependent DNA helicase RecQ